MKAPNTYLVLNKYFIIIILIYLKTEQYPNSLAWHPEPLIILGSQSKCLVGR